MQPSTTLMTLNNGGLNMGHLTVTLNMGAASEIRVERYAYSTSYEYLSSFFIRNLSRVTSFT